MNKKSKNNKWKKKWNKFNNRKSVQIANQIMIKRVMMNAKKKTK